MSDFFTNLVTRNLGTAPAIRPRLTSLFEPIRGDARSIGDTFASEPNETLAHPENEFDTESSRWRRVDPHRAESSPKNEQRSSDIEIEAQSSPLLVPSIRPLGDSQKPLVTEGAAKNESPRAAPQQPTSPAVSNQTLVVPAVHQEAATVDAKQASVNPAVIPATTQRQASEDTRGLLIPPKLTPEMRLSDLALSARLDRQTRQEKRSPLSDVSQPSEPTIEVTIGRIEVRATKESAHPTRTSSPSPVMSLDEYLRGRRGVRQ